MGIQVQTGINNGPNGQCPYTYCVILADKKFGLIDKFNKYDDFLNYLERIKTIKFLKGKVLKYSSSIIDGKNVIRVIDAAGNNILFIESGINNYTVRFEL